LLTAVPTISVVRKRVSSDLHLIDLVSDLPDVRMGETGAILIGLLATIILGVTATLLPLYSGSRALRELEH
jgi:hypothetical protein